MTYNAKEGSKERRLRNKLQAIKALGGKCSRCMTFFKDTEVYDFHHVVKGEKEFPLANMWSLSWERIRKELRKCALLCANCHRIIHKEENKDG